TGDFDPGHAGLEIITVVGTKSLQGTRHSTVQVLHADGSALDNGAWPYRVPEVPLDPLRDLQAATLADIDLDGALDLIVYLHKKLHILNFAGDNIANAFLQGYGFQVTSGGKLIAAGELDGDPLPELVHGEFDLALDESSLYVWDLEDVEPGLLIEMGDLMAGLQEDPPDLYRLEHLTLADLDEDPQLELVLLLANKMQVDPWSYKTRDYTLVGLNSHGNGEWSLAGGEWPVLLDETGTIALFPDSMVFVVPADLDLDGAPELIASTRNTINIRRADGSPYLDHALPGMVFESSPVVADISGGGFHPEIIANSLFSSIFAWDHLGSAIGGFPMATINPIIGAPAVGDVDGDGDKEVVVRDVPLMPFFGDPSWIYVFDGGGSGPDPWPMVRGCPEATNAQPVPSTPAPERGDANEDGEIDIGDVAFLATFLFLAGPAPSDLDLLDTNSDTQIDIADIVFLLAYLFNGGPAPAP
ncbi:MAG: dockerin type I domain-containing protein, partial [Planctomycetota bacterium]